MLSKTDSHPGVRPGYSERKARHYLQIPIMAFLSALLVACAVEQPVVTPSATPSAPASAPVPQPEPEPIEAAPAPETAAPSPDKIASLQNWVDQQNRLYRVAAPLLLHNTELCDRHARHLLGLTAKNRYSYSTDHISSARAALGLGERLRVMNVLPGSSAERAGVQKGDTLLAIGNEPLPQGAKAEQAAARMVGTAMRGRTNISMSLLRDGKRMSVEIPLTRACAFGIELGDADHVNSYADGYRVMVTRGTLAYTQSDEELAYVLAKGIAHNIVAPAMRPDMGQTIDRLLLGGSGFSGKPATAITPYSPVLDATADKLALYLLVRAGYRIDNALPFWKRLAARYPAAMPNSHTALHPSTNYRFSVMNEIAKVVRQKQENGLPLVP